MKNTFLLLLLTIGIGDAHSQTFKPYKVDASIGYANPRGNIAKAGALFALEPKYALADPLSLGLRWEGALTAAMHYDANGRKVTGDVRALSSWLATTDYYFSTNSLRPFAGGGAGVYRLANVGADTDDVNNPNYSAAPQYASKFGFMLRGGLEFGHLRTGLEYNIIGNKNNYLGIKLGIGFGGGRLKQQDSW